MKTKLNKFAERLKQLRMKNNMLQKDLAKIIEVKPYMISKWERGVCEPEINMVVYLAILFNVTTDYIIGRDYN